MDLGCYGINNPDKMYPQNNNAMAVMGTTNALNVSKVVLQEITCSAQYAEQNLISGEGIGSVKKLFIFC